MVYGVSVTPANVAPSTVKHGRTLHQPRDSRRCLAMFSRPTVRHLTATIVDLNIPTLPFLFYRIEERAIQKLRGKGMEIEL